MENLCLCLSPVILLALYCTAVHVINKLRNLPPSPFPALPFIGHIYLLKRPFHRSLSEVSRRYGPALFLKLGSRAVFLVSSPSLVEECLTNKNDLIFANRPDFLNGRHFGYNYTSLSWSSYGDHWRNLRKISSIELLSSHRIQMLSQIRADETLNLVRKLLHVTGEEPDRVVEVKSALFEYMFNVLTRMVMGKRYYGKSVKNLKEANLLEEITTETTNLAFETNVIDYLHNLRFQVLLQGGSSTSAIAVEWAFTLLLDNPRVLKRAQSEIDTNVGTERLIAESDVAALPYLRQIILETLRLHPPVSIIMPHRSSAECTVGGYRIPAGTILLVNTWEIHHNPKFWADPEKFKPERFEGLKRKKNLGFRFIPFGSGRRACPGENLAISTIGLGLGSLIQCFDWIKIGEIDMSEGPGVTTPKVQPLIAKCTPRAFVKKIVY